MEDTVYIDFYEAYNINPHMKPDKCLSGIFEPSVEADKFNEDLDIFRDVMSGDEVQELKIEEVTTAEEYLEQAAQALANRAETRDCENGERSAQATADIFNAMTGYELTERDVWQFLIALKFGRMKQGGYNEDDYLDVIGYSALLAEHANS